MPNRYANITLEERFWSKVTKTDTCWLWNAALFPNGYGHFYLQGRHCLAHRVAWELTYGPIGSTEILVCHNCPDGDNPRCVNPAHLWLGDDKANMQDAVHKGRLKSPNPGLQGKWSNIGVSSCKGCQTTTRRHWGKGYCAKCYTKHIGNDQRKSRYHNASPEEKATRLAIRRDQYRANPEKYREERRRSDAKKRQEREKTL